MVELRVSRTRAEQLIAVSRLLLACFYLAVVWWQPSARVDRRFLLALVGAYGIYSLLVAVTSWRRPGPPRHGFLSHVADLAIVLLSFWASEEANTLLFPFFVFVLFAGTVRWQRTGALWSAAVVIGAVVGVGIYETMSHPVNGAEFKASLIRYVSLAATAVILFGVALCETAARRKLQLLATEPDLPLGNFDKLLGGLLGWAAGVMRVRQVVIAWEETDEPWLHVASWQQGSYKRTREAPVTFDPMLRAEVADVGFLCQNTDRPDAAVLRAAPGGFDWWHGQPIHPDFRDRFGMSSVLSTPMRTETSKGWLFFLDRADKSRMTADDLTMGGILSERVGNWLNRAHLAQLLATNAALEERARVARDLHDSAFHGLTGLALELERLRAMSQAVLPEARRRLEEIQQTVVETQRSMRLLIKSLRRPTPSISPPLGGELRTRLSNLCQRLERQWGLRVESIISGLETVSPERLNDVYFLVHEALINVARHAGASVARLEVAVRSGRVHIDVSDDGRGFAFKGRHDHSTLLARQLGPATLMERAAILGGVMTVDSSETGTRLEIAFPIATVEG